MVNCASWAPSGGRSRGSGRSVPPLRGVQVLRREFCKKLNRVFERELWRWGKRQNVNAVHQDDSSPTGGEHGEDPLNPLSITLKTPYRMTLKKPKTQP